MQGGHVGILTQVSAGRGVTSVAGFGTRYLAVITKLAHRRRKRQRAPAAAGCRVSGMSDGADHGNEGALEVHPPMPERARATSSGSRREQSIA